MAGEDMIMARPKDLKRRPILDAFVGTTGERIIRYARVPALVVRNVVKLVFERRRGILGAKLRTRLIAAFVGLSIVPSVLLFWVAAEFITATVERWFSSQVYSLSQSLEVAEVYYQNTTDNAMHYARQISRIITRDRLLSEANLNQLQDFVNQKQEEYNLGVVEVFSLTLEELVKSMNPGVPVKDFVGSESALVQKGLVSGGAVQIGNAITEKMVLDVLMVARDRGLYNAVTDCGAGGFSSAVGVNGRAHRRGGLARAPAG